MIVDFILGAVFSIGCNLGLIPLISDFLAHLNAESALVIVTIALVVATIALVVATILIADYNKKMWIAQDKPWLYFKIEYVGKVGYYTVENVGKGVALDVKFKFSNGTLNDSCSYPLIPLKEKFSLTHQGNGDWDISKKLVITDIVYEDINRNPCKQDDFEL